MNKKIAIVIPLYNDWQSLTNLVKGIESCLGNEHVELFVVNDCSIEEPPVISSNIKIKIINLKVNLGHQRAIAIGLAYCNEISYLSEIIVMDADGEDDPKYLKELLKKSRITKKIVFAERVNREEGVWFKLFYVIYKFVFKRLTDEKISFGNYSIIPKELLPRVVSVPELWNHFSVAIMKSKIPYDLIKTDRAKRYYGKSKMNFGSLVIHGFSAISIFLERVLTKVIFTTLIVLFCCIMLSGIVLYRKFVMGEASPGWATTALFGFTIVSLLMLIFSFLIGLSYLNSRKEFTEIDYLSDNYKKFIKN